MCGGDTVHGDELIIQVTAEMLADCLDRKRALKAVLSARYPLSLADFSAALEGANG
jgi:hypothetical protein